MIPSKVNLCGKHEKILIPLKYECRAVYLKIEKRERDKDVKVDEGSD